MERASRNIRKTTIGSVVVLVILVREEWEDAALPCLVDKVKQGHVHSQRAGDDGEYSRQDFSPAFFVHGDDIQTKHEHDGCKRDVQNSVHTKRGDPEHKRGNREQGEVHRICSAIGRLNRSHLPYGPQKQLSSLHGPVQAEYGKRGSRVSVVQQKLEDRGHDLGDAAEEEGSGGEGSASECAAITRDLRDGSER